MFKSLQKKLAVDLGSQKIKIAVVSEVINANGNLQTSRLADKVINDYACLARRKKDGKVLAFGLDAYEMRGRLLKEVEIIFPFDRGRILDRKAAKDLLRFFFRKAIRGTVFNPIVMVTTTADINQFSKDELTTLLYDLNFSEVYLIAQPLASAVGAGVPVADASGTLFLQMGASQSELAVISLGSVSAHKTISLASLELSREIARHLAKNEDFLLGLEAIRKIKRQILNVDPEFQAILSLTGKSLKTGAPLEIKVRSKMLWPVMKDFREQYLLLIKSLLKEIPPELTEDILDKGLLLAGGLAQIDGLEAYFSEELGIPVAVVDDPELSAVKGAVLMLNSLQQFKSSLAFEV